METPSSDVTEKKDPVDDNNTNEHVKQLKRRNKEEYEHFLPTTIKYPFYDSLVPLVYWSDPVRTSLFFIIGNLFFFLITYGEYSIVSLVSSIFLSLLFTSFLYIKIMVIKGGDHPFESKDKPVDFGVPREQLEQYVDGSLHLYKTIISTFRDTVSFKYWWLSLKVVGVTLILRVLGNWFSLIFMLYIVFLIIFIWPILYEEKKKKEIEAGVVALYVKIKPLVSKLPKVN